MSSLYLLLQAAAIALILLVLLVILKIMRSFRDDSNENKSGAALVGLKEVLEAEKRTTDRRNVRIPVIIEALSQSVRGQTKDLSVSGAFIHCQTAVPMGETFKITLKPQTDQELSLDGEVVWSNLNMKEDTVVNRGMGIRFIGLSDTDRENLGKINQ